MTGQSHNLRFGLARLLSAALLVASCAFRPTHRETEPHGSNAPNDVPLSQRSSIPVLPPRALTAPDVVAKQWFAAYWTTRWTDSSPAAWIDRVRPYVTPAMHLRDVALREGGGGTDWTGFVAGRCVTVVSDLNAVVPVEAPNTATVTYVQVIGSVRTTCSRKPPTSPADEESATLAVSKTPNDWLVDERLY